MHKLPSPDLKWPIILDGVALIAESENCFLKTYRCPAGVPTIGWGETQGVVMGMEWTQEQADQKFCDSLTASATEVLAALTVAPSEHELAALTSFAYNCRGWKKSSVIKAHNRGDRTAAANALLLWDKATIGGVLTVLNGLTVRRHREAAMYLTHDEGAPAVVMAQAVADEPKLAESPTVKTSVAMGTTGAVVLATQIGEQAATVKTAVVSVKSLAVDAFGIPADWFLPAVMIAGSLYVVWRRYGQRLKGLA